jgi:hypothetical protein
MIRIQAGSPGVVFCVKYIKNDEYGILLERIIICAYET